MLKNRQVSDKAPGADNGTRPFPFSISARAWLVILIALVARIWVYHKTVIVNPDGVLYIHQAMTLYLRDWAGFRNCGLTFLSSFSIFIAGAYVVFQDWILSARIVCLFFGTAFIIPVYLLLKEFVKDRTAVLCILVFAVTPVLVSNSVELVKEPICWFFLAAGIYLIIRDNKDASPWLLTISSLCFLVAALTRIETIIYLVITFGYLCFHIKGKRGASRLFFFLLPCVMIVLLGIFGNFILGIQMNNLHRANEISGKIFEPIIQYKNLAAGLKDLSLSSSDMLLKFFLPEARNTIWLIGLGTVVNRLMEAFFYPFVLFYLIGLSGIASKIKSDKRLLYLLLLAASGLAVLYIHTIHTWFIYYRFFGIVMIPASILCAFGLEKILDFFQQKFSLRASTVYILAFVMITAITIAKNTKSPDHDKIVFIEIANAVSHHSQQAERAKIASSCMTQNWVSFYANIENPQSSSCPYDARNCWESFPDDHDLFFESLRHKEIQFVLWEEKNWPAKRFLFSDAAGSGRYTELGQWYHKDTGKMILYSVRKRL